LDDDAMAEEPDPSHSENLEAAQPFIRRSQSSQGSRQSGPTSRDKRSELSSLNALALIVGLQVGSGIFASPSQISRNVPSPGVGVLVWLLAGVLVWTGAATLVELGLQMPENGGIQEYLRCCYGDYMGCVFSWAWVWISKASSLAIITGVFADYLHRAFSTDVVPSWLAAKLVGMVGLWLITVLNWSGPKAGATMANGLFVLKVMLLASILVAGVQLQLAGKTDGSPASKLGWFGSDPSDGPLSGFTQSARFVAAIFGALFSYNGWESVRSNAPYSLSPYVNVPDIQLANPYY
jgi:solute carrier family 7 (L-type amino acid transporter), member 6